MNRRARRVTHNPQQSMPGDYYRLLHWRRSILLMFTMLIVAVGVLLALPLIVGQFSAILFLGFPVSYLLLSHGAILMLVIGFCAFAARQNKVDRVSETGQDL